MQMFRRASFRGFWLVLLALLLQPGHAQDFGRLYEDSVTITLSEPLKWVAVPKAAWTRPTR